MSNQRTAWSDPTTRAARQARAEAFLGRPMQLGPGPAATHNGGAADVPHVRLALETAERLRKKDPKSRPGRNVR